MTQASCPRRLQHDTRTQESHYTMTYVTFSPGAFLGGNTTCDRKQHGLVLLNQPITNMELFKQAWTFCERRICADGGANRLFDALKTDEERLRFLPDVIVGDFDSLRDNVRQWYEDHGVLVKHDTSQDTTDFMKAVTLGNELYQVHGLLVLGALGGRLDHTFHSIFHLFLSLKHHQTVYLLNDACVSFLLHPNVPNIVKTPRTCLERLWVSFLLLDLPESLPRVYNGTWRIGKRPSTPRFPPPTIWLPTR